MLCSAHLEASSCLRAKSVPTARTKPMRKCSVVKVFCDHICRGHLFKYYIYLYAPFTLHECHAIFYWHWFRRAVREGTQAKTIKMKIVSKDIRTSNILNRTVVPYTPRPH